MGPEERLWIRSGALRLEGAFTPSDPGEARGIAALLCHPHPLYGGDMDNGVVLGLRETLVEGGVPVLRFNFRGVGRSEGRYAEGVGERNDVRAAIDALAEATGSERILVAGYSFGAWVGLAAAAPHLRVGSLAAVAPPLAMGPMADLSECSKPKLAVVGGQDERCPLDRFEDWFGGLADPKEKAILPGADHFLRGREREVGALVARFAAAPVRAAAG